MIRMTTRLRAKILSDFTDGISMSWLAVRWNVPLTTIEAIIRQAMQKVHP